MVDSTTVHCADEEDGLYQAILYEVLEHPLILISARWLGGGVLILTQTPEDIEG